MTTTPDTTGQRSRVVLSADMPDSGFSAASIAPSELTALLRDLQAAGVTLPDYAANLAEVFDGLQASVLPVPPIPDLLGADLDTVMQTAIERAQHRALTSTLPESTREVAEHLLATTIRALAADADQILDQMRPLFDKHAKVIANARKLGLTAATTAEEAIEMGAKAGEAWRAARDAAYALDSLAADRLQMTKVLGIEPYPRFTIRGWAEDPSHAFTASLDWWKRRDRWWTGTPQLRTLAEVTESWTEAVEAFAKPYERIDVVVDADPYTL